MDERPDLYLVTNAEEQYKLALRSILRWTGRRDTQTDAEIIKAVKQVALTALKDF